MIRILSLSLIILSLAGCKTNSLLTSNDIKIASAMRNVMWKGELAGVIQMDTIAPKAALYGLGPL